MGGIGFNLITAYAVLVTGALTYALGRNITTGKDLAAGLGAEYKKQLAAWRAKRKAS